MCLICGRAVSSKVRMKRGVKHWHTCWWLAANGDTLTSCHPCIFGRQHKMKTSATEVVSLTAILYRISLLLCLYFQIPCSLFWLCNKFKWPHSNTIPTDCPFKGKHSITSFIYSSLKVLMSIMKEVKSKNFLSSTHSIMQVLCGTCPLN